MIKILLKEAVEKITPQQAKEILVKTMQSLGLEYCPDIETDFALTVAFRESSFNPYVAIGTKLGIFQVGKEAAREVGELESYPMAAQDVNVGIRIGLKYLQRQYDFVKQEYPSSKYNLYALTYIAFNMGRVGLVNIIRTVEGRAEPDPNVASAVKKQTEAFAGKDDKETMINYYNTINKLFAQFK